MGFLDSIFGFNSDTHRINRQEFNTALHQIPDLDENERNYLNEVFNKDLEDGLTAFELKNRIEKLRHNPDDCLNPHEVEEVRRKLLNAIENK